MDGSRSSDDRTFQAAGPDVENARGPNVDVSVLGTTSSCFYLVNHMKNFTSQGTQMRKIVL